MGFIFPRQDCPHYSGAVYPKATNKAPSQHGDKSQTFRRLLNVNALWHSKRPLIPAGSSPVPAPLEAKRALGSSWAGNGICWDKGAWLLQHRDIWVSSGGAAKSHLHGTQPPKLPWLWWPQLGSNTCRDPDHLCGTQSSQLDADQGEWTNCFLKCGKDGIGELHAGQSCL